VKKIIVFLLFSITVTAQNYLELFKLDFPKNLNIGSEVVQTAVSRNLERAAIIGPEAVYIYLEHLKLRIDEGINSSEDNYQKYYNKLSSKFVFQRNQFINSERTKLLINYPDFWEKKSFANQYFDMLLFPQDNAVDENLSPYKFNENKVFYYNYKLLLNESEIAYSDQVNYRKLYQEESRKLISRFNSILSAREFTDENLEFIKSTLNNSIWLVKGGELIDVPAKVNYKLSEIVEQIALHSEVDEKNFVVSIGFSPLFPEIEEQIYYKVLGYNPLVLEDTYLKIGITKNVNFGLGYRMQLFSDKTYLSYIEGMFYYGVTLSHTHSGSLLDSNKTLYSIKRSENPREIAYRWIETANISSRFYNATFSTPLMRTGDFAVIGVQLDLVYITMRYESLMYKYESATRLFREHTFTDFSVLPGIWIEAKLLGPIHARLRGATNGYFSVNIVGVF